MLFIHIAFKGEHLKQILKQFPFDMLKPFLKLNEGHFDVFLCFVKRGKKLISQWNMIEKIMKAIYKNCAEYADALCSQKEESKKGTLE